MALLLKERRHRHALQASRGEQIALRLHYERLVREGAPQPPWGRVEFRNYSQTGEDGILLYLASLLKIDQGRIVELCCGDGVESNSANLILNHGWSGLLVDGDAKLIATAQAFYAHQPETRRVPPTILHAWITSSNVSGILADNGYDRDIDVLSLDLDGVDLWIARALAECDAKVIVAEYNNRIPPGNALTVPDVADFRATGQGAALTHGPGYFGASLDAFVKVLKNHRLVGANSVNTNAVFVRNDLVPDLLPAVTTPSCLSSPWATLQRERHWAELSQRDWLPV